MRLVLAPGTADELASELIAQMLVATLPEDMFDLVRATDLLDNGFADAFFGGKRSLSGDDSRDNPTIEQLEQLLQEQGIKGRDKIRLLVEEDLVAEKELETSGFAVDVVAARLKAFRDRSATEGPSDPAKRRHRNDFESLVDDELDASNPYGFFARVALAELVSDSFRGVSQRSTCQIGNKVHNALQFIYSDRRGIGRNRGIVQEWYVYTYVGRKERRVTITDYTRYEFRPENPNPDRLWAAIETARLRPADPNDVKDLYKERWDTLDVNSGEVWEIKPVRSLRSGVAQESYYRHKIMFHTLTWLDDEEHIVSRRIFVPGKSFPTEGLQIPVGNKIAIPFNIVGLPGMVAYSVHDGESDLERVWQRVQRALRKLAELKKRC